MPELPEVETIRRDLEKDLVSRQIRGLETSSPKLFQPSFEAVLAGVIGQQVTGVGRQAKLLYLSLSNSQYLLVHLKMTGRLLLREKGAPKDEFQRATFLLDNGHELRFADMRLFGYLKLVDQLELEKILAGYGPEPLKNWTAEDFKEAVKGRRKPIKVLLLDQELISGVGNIYANEALFRAGIDPRKMAGDLTEEEVSLLFGAVESVLAEALQYRGTTADDDKYVDAHGHKGQFQDRLQVYRREGQPCLKCGSQIARLKLGGRGTFYCPHCQPE